jgi:hypothetical protein
MQLLEQINQTRKYLDYIEEHVLNVRSAWQEIQAKCKDMNIVYDDFYYKWIDEEVFRHDLSKLSEQEFVQYRKSFYPTDIESKYDMSEAWKHHKANNPHHWENWTKKDMSMPIEWAVHCTHMVIDWMAMGYKFGDTAQQYYEANKDKIELPDYAVDFIYEIFKRLDC